MRYLPKSPAERQAMLDAIGARSISQLFRTVPEKFRLNEPLNLPGPMSVSYTHLCRALINSTSVI